MLARLQLPKTRQTPGPGVLKWSCSSAHSEFTACSPASVRSAPDAFLRECPRFRLSRPDHSLPFQKPATPRTGRRRAGPILALALLWPVHAAAQIAVQTYTVRPGDTAYSVARLAGTDVPTLLNLNDLTAPELRAGQVLRLPAGPGKPGPAKAAPQPPRSHTVGAGQTLYSVARLYGLKAAALQDFNHLSSPDLKPGQVLLLPVWAAPPEPTEVRAPLPPASVGSAPVVGPPPVKVQVVLPPKPTPEPAPTGRHTVQPGETLYSVARLYGLRPLELLAYNRLGSSDLKAGQVLLLPTGVSAQVPALPVLALPPASAVPSGAVYSPGVPLPPPPIQAQPEAPRSDLAPSQDVPDITTSGFDWRGLALSFLGVPYVYGGNSRSGTDCSGLVIQVFSQLGLKLPRQSALQAQTGLPVDVSELQAGDLLFFDTEGRGTVTHVGIFLGDYQGLEGAFINANSFGGRVAVNQLSEKYFAQRYLWARRVIGVLAQGH